MRVKTATLIKNLNVTPEVAEKIRLIMAKPASEKALEEIDKLLETYGVEGFTTKNPSRAGTSYCNTGDPYTCTIMVRTNRYGESKWHIGDIGTILERSPGRNY